MPLVNPVTVRPTELEIGMVMAVVVTVHIVDRGDGRMAYRMYRCDYPPQTHEGIPQGSRIEGDRPAIAVLMPVIGWAGTEEDR